MPAPGVWQIDVIDTSTLKVISTIKNGHAWIPILRERKENITIEAALALCMKFKRALNPPPAAVIEDLVPARSAAANAVSTDVASQPLAGDDLNGDGALDLVTAGSVNTVVSTVSYAGPQGDYPGLDQVNLLLPRNLAGRGMIDIVLTVDDTQANRVRVRIR